MVTCTNIDCMLFGIGFHFEDWQESRPIEESTTTTIAKKDAEIERLRLVLIYINNFADEDTAYMVGEMQRMAKEALEVSHEK